jgi:hypothetical protein
MFVDQKRTIFDTSGRSRGTLKKRAPPPGARQGTNQYQQPPAASRPTGGS